MRVRTVVPPAVLVAFAVGLLASPASGQVADEEREQRATSVSATLTYDVGEGEELKAFTTAGFLGAEFGPFGVPYPDEAADGADVVGEVLGDVLVDGGLADPHGAAEDEHEKGEGHDADGVGQRLAG